MPACSPKASSTCWWWVVKTPGCVEKAEMTPIVWPPSLRGTQSMARIPSCSSMSRRAERGSVRMSLTRMATPLAAQRPLMPSPTGMERARQASVLKPCAAACTRFLRSFIEEPDPASRAADEGGDGSADLIQHRGQVQPRGDELTRADERRHLLGTAPRLVDEPALLDGGRHRPRDLHHESRRRWRRRPRGGVRPRRRRRIRRRGTRGARGAARGNPRRAGARAPAPARSLVSTSSRRSGSMRATILPSRAPSSGRGRRSLARAVVASRSTLSGGSRSVSRSATPMASKATSRASPSTKTSRTSSSACRELPSSVTTLRTWV